MGLQVILEVPVFVKDSFPVHQLDKLIVILKDNNDLYHIHCYFPLMKIVDGKAQQTFEISADLQRGNAKQVFDTLCIRFPDGLKTNIF